MSDYVADKLGETASDKPVRPPIRTLLGIIGVGAVLVATALLLAQTNNPTAGIIAIYLLSFLALAGALSLVGMAMGLLVPNLGGLEKNLGIATKALDHMTDGFVLTNRRGAVLYANKSYRHLTGTLGGQRADPPERFFASDEGLRDALYGLTRAAARLESADVDLCLAQSTPQFQSTPQLESQSRQGAEGPRWFHTSVRPLDAGGDILWQIVDVTDQRLHEAELSAAHRLLSDHMDSAPVGYYAARSGGEIVLMNETLKAWLNQHGEIGASPEVLSNIIAGEGVPVVAAAGDAAHFDVDLAVNGGGTRPAHIIARRSVGEDALTHAIVLDLAEGSWAANADSTAERRFARFFNNAPIGLVTLDKDWRIEEANSAFINFSGMDPEAPVKLTDLVAAGEAEALSARLSAVAGGQSSPAPIEIRFTGPEERIARVYASPIEDEEDGRARLMVYLIDTSAHKTLEAQVAQSQKMQAVGQLAGGVAHDFNNLLTAIIGYSDLLLGRHQAGDPSFADIMQIKQNANRAAGLVRQLLAFSRQQTLRPRELDFTEQLAEATSLLRRLLGENVQLTINHGRALWPVMVDPTQFDQVIINLAVNARDAMPRGGSVTIRTANISVEESRELGEEPMPPGEYVMCEVVDAGTGIPEEHLQKIFDPFFSTKDVGQGTGLGLSTVYGVVKQTGGFIFVENGPEYGATFRIFLPRHIPDVIEQPDTPEEAAPAESARDHTGKGTILLVEDEDAVRTFVSRALGTRGYTVLEAADGEDALEVVEEHDGDIDLVISDVVMPGMDGPSLITELKKRSDEPLKVIFMSGYAESALREGLEEHKDTAFLPKPFSLKEVAEKVKDVMAGG